MLEVSGKIDLANGVEISSISTESPISWSTRSQSLYNMLNKFALIKYNVAYYLQLPASNPEVAPYIFNNGLVNNTITITSSTPFTSFYVVFDYKNGVYANSIQVDSGEAVVNNSAIFFVDNLSSATSHTIKFLSKNKNEMFVITGIFSKLSVDIDDRRLDEFTLEHQSVGDNERPSFGIISNSGNISLIDYDLTFKTFAQVGLLNEGCPVTMTMTDTITGKTETIGKYLTNSWDYNANNNTVSVSLKDDLLTWQELAFDGFVGQIQHFDEQAQKYYYSDNGNYTDIYQKITENFPNVTIVDFFDISFIELLDSLIDGEIQICQMNRSAFWGAMQKLCEVAGVHIFKTYNNEIGFSYGY